MRTVAGIAFFLTIGLTAAGAPWTFTILHHPDSVTNTIAYDTDGTHIVGAYLASDGVFHGFMDSFSMAHPTGS